MKSKLIAKRKPRKTEIICKTCNSRFNLLEAPISIGQQRQCPTCGTYILADDYQLTSKSKKRKVLTTKKVKS